MDSKFLNYLSDPEGKTPLKLFVFEQIQNNIVNGLLLNEVSFRAYPIIQGVPVFINSGLPQFFRVRFAKELEVIYQKYPGIQYKASKDNKWSFSLEWEEHKSEEMTTTWGWSLDSRYHQFLMETQTEEKDNIGKLILDAGCGNGMLTEHYSGKGMISIGIDYSDSVFAAEKNRKSENVCYIKGDLQSPPFASGLFDIIVSNGVIHHTKSTEKTFYPLADILKSGGKIYLWLYSRKGNFGQRLQRLFFDVTRMMICRLPDFMKKIFVNIFTFVIGSIKSKLDKKTLKISMWDVLTPRWRHYHTTEEISRWFFNAGFGPLVLTHWDNPYGFGAYAIKTKLTKTPGVNFNEV